MTKVINCFEVMLWDGGDRHLHECYVESKDDAHSIAGKHGLVIPRSIVIYENKNEYESMKSGKIKEQALSKLTDLELKALGLTR